MIYSRGEALVYKLEGLYYNGKVHLDRQRLADGCPDIVRLGVKNSEFSFTEDVDFIHRDVFYVCLHFLHLFQPL